MGAQTAAFAERFRVLAPERRAHGHTADVEGPLTYAGMAADTIGFLEHVVGDPAHQVGWNDGGIIGFLVAIARPDLVRKLVAIGSNFDTVGVVPEAEGMFTRMTPDSRDMARLRGLCEMHSPDGPEHWPVVFGKFAEMVKREPHIDRPAASRDADQTR